MTAEKDEPLISVVIPVYNVERYLRQCVDSVLAQTVKDIEIVLVDDESPDGCPAICDAYASSQSRIKVVHKRNGGLGMARNSGIERASGRYIFFLDSDDYLPPDALEILLRTAERERADVVHGRLNRFVTPGVFSATVRGSLPVVIRDRNALRRVALCTFGYADCIADARYSFEGSACAALYRREFLESFNLRFLSERQYISEDYIFNYDCALRASCICQTGDTVYHYRVNPDSLTQAPRTDVMPRVADYCEKISAMFRNDGYGPEAERHAAAYALSRIRAQYKYLFLGSAPWRVKLERAREMRSLPYFDNLEPTVEGMRLSKIHRLSYRLFRSRSWRLMSSVIRMQSAVRRLLGRIES